LRVTRSGIAAMSPSLRQVYEQLLSAFGPQHWWPGESPFEVLVGAVLTQNTSWKNVARAIDNLRDADVLSAASMYNLAPDELAELIRPAGYYRLKAKRLRNLLELIMREHDGSLEAMFATDLTTLREQLLSVNGVGPETADSICLYAAEMPTFVVDAYTARVLKRHGWIEPEADYYAIKEHFESQLDDDVQLFNEFHALLVRVGNQHCRRTPKCDGCPLECWLPPSGIHDWK
jgi:endonuclease-3 related protein